MPTATIVANYVNPPKPPAKSGTIRVPSGEYYGIQPNWVNQFAQGQTYDIEYTITVAHNGREYKNITKFAMAQGAPAAAQPNTGGKYGTTDDKTAERIFVCGALNAAIQSGRVELAVTDLVQIVQDLRTTWANTFGAPAQTNSGDMSGGQGRHSLDDEIPFMYEWR